MYYFNIALTVSLYIYVLLCAYVKKRKFYWNYISVMNFLNTLEIINVIIDKTE